MNIALKKISLINLLFYQMVIIVIAFADYKYLNIISVLLGFGACLLTFFMEKKINFNLIKFSFFKMIFLAWCFLSILWSVNPSNSLYFSISIIMRLLASIAVITYVYNYQSYVSFIKVLVVAVVILCIRLLIHVPLSEFGNSRIGNYLAHDADSSYGNTQLTYVFGCTIAILLFDENKTIKNRFLKYLLIFIFTVFSLLSGSKKQIFFLVISIFTFVFIKVDKPLVLIRNLIISIGLLAVGYILLTQVDVLYNSVGYRIENFFNVFSDSKTTDISTQNRLLFLAEAKRVFLIRPFLGVGVDGFRFENSILNAWAENNFMEILADLGVIGFILYYIPFIFIIWYLTSHKKMLTKGTIAQIVNLMLIILFIDFTMVSYRNLILQFFLAFLFALSTSKKEEDNS